MRKLASIFTLLALTACGTSNSDGSVATGPLGQQPLMTPEVQKLTRTALDACIAAKTRGVPLANLQSQGFKPFRGGYRSGIPNPHILFNGKSYVWARLDRGACKVFTGPVYPIELQTLMSLTRTTLGESSTSFDVTFRDRNDGIDTILE